MLLGADAQPAIISQLRSGQSDDEDLGEQVRAGGGCLICWYCFCF